MRDRLRLQSNSAVTSKKRCPRADHAGGFLNSSSGDAELQTACQRAAIFAYRSGGAPAG
jgi:hypothetical protein